MRHDGHVWTNNHGQTITGRRARINAPRQTIPEKQKSPVGRPGQIHAKKGVRKRDVRQKYWPKTVTTGALSLQGHSLQRLRHTRRPDSSIRYQAYKRKHGVSSASSFFLPRGAKLRRRRHASASPWRISEHPSLHRADERGSDNESCESVPSAGHAVLAPEAVVRWFVDALGVGSLGVGSLGVDALRPGDTSRRTESPHPQRHRSPPSPS